MNARFHILSSVLDLASRGAFSREYRLADESQWQSPEAIAVLQFERLKSLLRHAEGTVPYYARRFAECGVRAADIRAPADLERLPVLTKADVMADPALLRSTAPPSKGALRKATGGSTGEMMVFMRDREAMARNFAHLVRNYTWTGLRPGEPHALLWGAHFDLKAQQRAANRVVNSCLKQQWMDAFRMSGETMRVYCDDLRRRRPRLLTAYASAATTLAEFVAEEIGQPLDLPAVTTTAEVLFPEARTRISQWLSPHVFDRFGCREVGNTAHECEAHDGLHVNAEHVLLEVVDEQGRAVAAGHEGEVLYTTLGNYVFPLIRYRVGDYAVREEPSALCRCGRGLPRIAAPRGRITDMLITTSGARVHGEYFTHLFYTMTCVRAFRVVQETERSLRVLVMLRSGAALPAADEHRLRTAIADKLGSDVTLQLEVVTEIPPSASGKHLFTECRVARGASWT